MINNKNTCKDNFLITHNYLKVKIKWSHAWTTQKTIMLILSLWKNKLENFSAAWVIITNTSYLFFSYFSLSIKYASYFSND